MKQIMSIKKFKEVINNLDNNSSVLIDRGEIFIISNDSVVDLNNILLDEIRSGGKK